MPMILTRTTVAAFCLVMMTYGTACAENTPTGTITKHSWAGSAIYPGAVFDYWVYVPSQYDGAKPACVYVNQDGIQFEAPTVFDTLISAGEMPIAIGVFVAPGRTAGFERGYEYESLNDNYVRFLNDELLPHIAADQGLRLSTQGNDRCIAGMGSGGLCAVTAAWERPEAFSRVFSAGGSFTSQRGGATYPDLIRLYEPRPLRIFLQACSGLPPALSGDVWLANQAMDGALEFSGYQCAHAWQRNGQEVADATAVFADAMRFLWKGYPQAVQSGHGSPQLQDILLPHEEWQLVGSGYKFTEGPAVSPRGEVYFNDFSASTTYKLDGNGVPQVFQANNHQGDGARFGPDGRLYEVAGDTRQVLSYDLTGGVKVISEGFVGNDVVVRRDGGVYVTESDWDGHSGSKVWFIPATGGDKKLVDKGLRFCNGVTLSPDEEFLYVDDSRSHWVYRYRVAADGTLSAKQKFDRLVVADANDDTGADGMRVDVAGRLYVATRVGIQVCNSLGDVLCIIPPPHSYLANLTFGGEHLDTIYCMCANNVYKRTLKVHGYEVAQRHADQNDK